MSEDYISSIRSATTSFFQHDSLKYSTKEYKIELKPLLSAFELRAFAMTSLRSFLMFYLPLLEPHLNIEEDDDEFLQDTQEERHLDLVVPFKKSVKQIVREVSCTYIPVICLMNHKGSALVHSRILINSFFKHGWFSWMVDYNTETLKTTCLFIFYIFHLAKISWLCGI